MKWKSTHPLPRFLLLCLLLVELVNIALAADPAGFSITTNEAALVQMRLSAYQDGKLTLGDLLGNTNQAEENCRQLVGYYLSHTNNFSTKAKLPISRCYVAFGDFSSALPLAHDYANIYSNDFNGWEVLAYCYVATSNDMQAIDAYTMAIKLGDKDSYQPLAGEAIRGHRLDIVQKILPELIALQHAKETSQDDKINLTTILLAYSLIADKKDLFIKTLEGQNIGELSKNGTIRENITSGCQMFEGSEIDKISQELKAAKDNK